MIWLRKNTIYNIVISLTKFIINCSKNTTKITLSVRSNKNNPFRCLLELTNAVFFPDERGHGRQTGTAICPL